MSVREVDLGKLPSDERELLTNLVKQVYSFMEVRNIINEELPIGQCQEDPTRYTRAPG